MVTVVHGAGAGMSYQTSEALYWSDDPADHQALRERCRETLHGLSGGQLYGAALYPLIGATVLLTRAGQPGRICQVFAKARQVRAVMYEDTPQQRGVTIPPEEVLLPWIVDHQPAIARARQTPPARKASPTASASGSPSRTAATRAKRTAVPTVGEAGQTSLPA